MSYDRSPLSELMEEIEKRRNLPFPCIGGPKDMEWVQCKRPFFQVHVRPKPAQILFPTTRKLQATGTSQRRLAISGLPKQTQSVEQHKDLDIFCEPTTSVVTYKSMLFCGSRITTMRLFWVCDGTTEKEVRLRIEDSITLQAYMHRDLDFVRGRDAIVIG